MSEKIKFKTFTEFCERAYEILKEFTMLEKNNKGIIREYKDYIYNNHNFSDAVERDRLAKDKIWEWIMSYKYEKMEINDLYSTLGQLKKGR